LHQGYIVIFTSYIHKPYTVGALCDYSYLSCSWII